MVVERKFLRAKSQWLHLQCGNARSRKFAVEVEITASGRAVDREYCRIVEVVCYWLATVLYSKYAAMVYSLGACRRTCILDLGLSSPPLRLVTL